MADLTPEQEQERLELIQRQNEAAKDLLSTYEKMRKVKGALTDDERANLNIAKDLARYSATIEKSVQKRLDETATAKSLTKNLNDLQREYNINIQKSGDIITKINKDRRIAAAEIRNLSAKELSLEAQIRGELAHQDVLQDRIDRLKGRSGLAARAALATARDDLRSSKAALSIIEKKLQSTTNQKNEQINLTKQLLEAKKAHDEILKAQKEEINLTKKEIALRKQKEAQEALSKALGIDKLKETLTLVGLMTFIVKAALQADDQAIKLGKSLGVSRQMAYGIRNEFVQYARATNDTFVTTARLMKAQAELTEQLGFAVNFGAQEAETFSRLTELVGLTAQEAGSLAKNSAAAGMETKDYVASIRSAAFYAQQTTKTHFSDKQILQEVSKLGAGILVKFQGNPKAIAQAVVEAKKLGSSLEQVNKIGDSLLNWEQSIENELEAELITGRQINVEKARYAALTGNQLDLTREIANQVGTLADFQNMNVIAQGSLAKAFGLSRDEMSEMLMKQEAINKYGDKAADLNAQQLKDQAASGLTLDEYLKKQDEQRTIQEKFNDAILKLQDFFGNLVAGPVGLFLQMLTDSLTALTSIATVMGTIWVLNQGIAAFEAIKLGIQTGQRGMALGYNGILLARQAIMSGELAKAIGIAAAWTVANFPMSLLGIVAAAGVGSLIYSQMSKAQNVQDGIAPPGSGPFTVTNKFGATAVTATGDGLAVSPNIRKGGDGGGIGPGTMVLAFKQALKEQGPSQAFIRGEDAFVSNIARNSNFGTSQNINTGYKVA
jgi:hypothetical protein